MIATVTVDRLMHHVHILSTDGQSSRRLAQDTAGMGVKPLTQRSSGLVGSFVAISLNNPVRWGSFVATVERNDGHQ